MLSAAEIYNTFIAEVTSTEITTTSAIFKLVVSMLLGSAVGFERKLKGQAAGIRTFALICMGATLAMIISIYVPQEYMGLKNGDPGRIAAQVVTGIGFLGAGAIIQMKGSVRGLTTAAGIWMIATIGMTVGLGMYWVSIVATVLILLILRIFERIEHKNAMGAESRIVRMVITCIVTDTEPYKEILERNNVRMSNMYMEFDYAEEVTRLNFIVIFKESSDYIDIFEQLRQVNPTKSITLTNQISF